MSSEALEDTNAALAAEELKVDESFSSKNIKNSKTSENKVKQDEEDQENNPTTISIVDKTSSAPEIDVDVTTSNINPVKINVPSIENGSEECIGKVSSNSDVQSADADPIISETTKDNDSTDYDPKDITYEGDIAIYTNPNTGHQFQWNSDLETWELRESTSAYGFENDTHTYTDKDGVTFEWDKEKSAWFPKIDDDFMAHYQMNYGFVSETPNNKPATEEKEVKKPIEKPTEQLLPGQKRKPSDPKWFEPDEEQNTKVYVSNLPLDITDDEFLELMQKCGIIMRDPVTNQMRIKLYKEPNSEIIKGDALCTYVRRESVDLAIKLIDGSNLRGKKIKVELAKFQMKGDYDPKLKPKSKKRKEKMKLKMQQEKMFDWRPEKMIGERAKHERIVILKNVFESKIFDEEVGLILEFQEDLREECTKCGDVKKVILYDRHPEGVAQVNMSAPEEADEVVKLLNGRWFGKRKLSAEIWDGKTKYKIQETDSQITERLGNWEKFLEDDKGAEKKE